MFRKPLFLAGGCLLLLAVVSTCYGDETEEVTFQQQPAQVGDQVGQK